MIKTEAHYPNKTNAMAKSGGLKNAPSTTGNKSGSGRSNNPPKSGPSKAGTKGGRK